MRVLYWLSMRQMGSSNLGSPQSRVMATALLLVTAIVWSCGGSSEQGASDANAGTGASSSSAGTMTGGGGAAVGGASVGGKGGMAGSSAGTNVSGDSPVGGAEPVGNAGAGGSSMAAGGGAGGAPDPLLGIECGDQQCAFGEACVSCLVEEMSERLCVPHPEDDPDGYAAAVEPCDAQLSPRFDDCDGPEDCEPNQFCVAREGGDGFMRCRDMPSTARSCCFACGALTDCTICRASEDCPDGETCSPAQAAPGVMGCH